jgi:membrane protein DedA with SNARE-associated domain
MLEVILHSISSLSPVWIYAILMLIPLVENIFPPSPSDTIIIVCASLIPLGSIHFIPAIILTTIGSETGFMILYYLGSQVDKKVVHSGKYRFLSKEGVERTEEWYAKYGCGILAVNRFLPGIRPVLAFFAGMSEIKINTAILYSTLSAILWNGMMLYLGIVFGANVERIDKFLINYSKIAIIILGGSAALFAVYYLYQKNRLKKIEN